MPLVLLLLLLLVHFLQMIFLDFLPQFAEHFIQLAKSGFLHFLAGTIKVSRQTINVGESFGAVTNLTRVKWDDWLMTETCFEPYVVLEVFPS